MNKAVEAMCNRYAKAFNVSPIELTLERHKNGDVTIYHLWNIRLPRWTFVASGSFWRSQLKWTNWDNVEVFEREPDATASLRVPLGELKRGAR